MKCIVPHAFGEHENCSQSWCGFKKDPLHYKHKDLPYRNDLYGDELKNALVAILDEYTTDTVTKKLAPFANSQQNEALNSIVGTKNPKIWWKRLQGCLCGCTNNIGYGYIHKTLSHLGRVREHMYNT